MLNYRYTIFSGFFQFLIPIIIITFIYLKILLFLKVKSTLSNSFDLVKFSVEINLNEILFEMNVKKLKLQNTHCASLRDIRVTTAKGINFNVQ